MPKIVHGVHAMKRNLIFVLFIVLLCTTACRALTPASQPPAASPSPVASATVETRIDGQPVAAEASAVPQELQNIRRQWALEARSDSGIGEPELALGVPDAPFCADAYTAWFNNQPESSPIQYSLVLEYGFGVIPQEVNIVVSGRWGSDQLGSTIRMELLNSRSGLGSQLYEVRVEAADDCPLTIRVPVTEEIEVDMVILSFDSREAPVFIDAVELAGVLPGYLDLPVFWRIPISADQLSDPDGELPGGMAADHLGSLFLANGRNGLHRYDFEGNLIKSYSVPMEANVRDVAVDLYETLVVTDMSYGWYIPLGYDGSQMTAGGEDFGWRALGEVAISPYDGNVYLLDKREDTPRIRVYGFETAEWMRDLPLEAGESWRYKGLAFDREGYLYTIDQERMAILQMDVATGAVLDELGHAALYRNGVYDFALDDAGNFYVLMSSSQDDSAVYILDARGELLWRLGQLTYDGEGWGEGVFLFPVSIAVSPDGRFVFLCENGFLTAYHLEE
jgi:hypothetical protein